MQPTLTRSPTFYLTARQPLRPSTILLATAAVVAVLSLVLQAMAHTRHVRLNSSPDRSSSASANSPADDSDDPNQIDTIVLGDPADAPTPGRKGDHVSPVHPFVIVRLPRFGNDTGLIPDTDSGRLLYTWLAAFNQSGSPDAALAALRSALPTLTPAAAAAQLELRRQTGGFNLVSAKEVQPGILVFRLRDQTSDAAESLGTLQVTPGSIPPRIATFSLRAVPAAPASDRSN